MQKIEKADIFDSRKRGDGAPCLLLFLFGDIICLVFKGHYEI